MSSKLNVKHNLPGFQAVIEAAHKLAGQSVYTPLCESDVLNRHFQGRVLFKAEGLQRTGSFKFRGAFNAVSRLSCGQRKAGVVAFSSGNHAQGIALAAKILGMPSLIVMPKDAPKIKIRGVLNYGGEIKFYNRAKDDRELLARKICAQRKAVLIPAFDHHDVIAGQGTCGLEIFNELDKRNLCADQLVCCVGGGGLIAGIGLAAKGLSPKTQIIGAEPLGFDDHRQSLFYGVRKRNKKLSGSICDAILAPEPGEMTWLLNKHQLNKIMVCNDNEVRRAIAVAFEQLKLVVEPGGAAAFATLLNEEVVTKDKTSVVILTGGNVDPEVFSEAIKNFGGLQ